MWKKKALTLTAAAITLVLAGCSSTAPEPAPPLQLTEQQQWFGLQIAWDSISHDDQASFCWLFKTDAGVAFDSFDVGAQGVFPRDVFDEFFSEHC